MARPVIDTGRAYFFLKIPYSLAQVMYDLLNDTYLPMLLLSGDVLCTWVVRMRRADLPHRLSQGVCVGDRAARPTGRAVPDRDDQVAVLH